MNKLKIYPDNRKYYSEEFIQGWERGVQNQFDADVDFLEDLLNGIRVEIERLHHHPKLDFIKNDDVVEMALEIIDKYR